MRPLCLLRRFLCSFRFPWPNQSGHLGHTPGSVWNRVRLVMTALRLSSTWGGRPEAPSISIGRLPSTNPGGLEPDKVMWLDGSESFGRRTARECPEIANHVHLVVIVRGMRNLKPGHVLA